MIKSESIGITGMSCASCALKIEKKLGGLIGVNGASVNLAMEKAIVEYNDDEINPAIIRSEITGLGYGIISENNKALQSGVLELYITGMSCANCALKIEKTLHAMSGV